MNRRGFFAALAGLPLAPIALKADPIEARLRKALALSNVPRTEIIWSGVQETWRIPEWQDHWKAMGARGAYIRPNDPDELPHYKEALEAAKKAGTAVRILPR